MILAAYTIYFPNIDSPVHSLSVLSPKENENTAAPAHLFDHATKEGRLQLPIKHGG